MSGSQQHMPIYVIAHQRSGTHYLRSLLDSTRCFTDIGEVFMEWKWSLDYAAKHWHQNLNYFRYRAEQFQKNPLLSVPTERNVLRVYQDFLSECQSVAAQQVGASRPLLIDVKYNSLHHLNKVWAGSSDLPFLLQWIEAGNGTVVHLIRRDVVARTISLMVANAARTFHFFKGKPEEYDPLVLSVSEFKGGVKKSIAHSEVVERWISELGSQRVTTLYYEDISTIDSFLSVGKPAIEKLLGIELPKAVKTNLRKGLMDPRSVVTNLDEILVAAADLGLETTLR